LLFLKDEFYSREFEGFIKGFSWHNDYSSFPLNFVSTLVYQVQLFLFFVALHFTTRANKKVQKK
ncbi:hypothetical protein ACVF0T_09455, partial [Streptococcus pyogenes]